MQELVEAVHGHPPGARHRAQGRRPCANAARQVTLYHNAARQVTLYHPPCCLPLSQLQPRATLLLLLLRLAEEVEGRALLGGVSMLQKTIESPRAGGQALLGRVSRSRAVAVCLRGVWR
jgi:hypothetical protein